LGVLRIIWLRIGQQALQRDQGALQSEDGAPVALQDVCS
jgi:hypothetical protein